MVRFEVARSSLENAEVAMPTVIQAVLEKITDNSFKYLWKYRPMVGGPGVGVGLKGFELRRASVLFDDYNTRVKRRYWICGTSLAGVIANRLVEKFLKNTEDNVDVKIIVPSTNTGDTSYKQLKFYDTEYHIPIDNQVDSAKRAFLGFKDQVEQAKPGEPLPIRLRRYCGPFPFNITIYDKNAYITYYGLDGVGDDGLTMHFKRWPIAGGYNRLVSEFTRMWEKSQ
jgi:hypothetical protein